MDAVLQRGCTGLLSVLKNVDTMSKKRTKKLQIVDRPFVSLDGKPHMGVCYRSLRLIEILETLESNEYMDTLIHEMLHYYVPELSERRVEKIATEIAMALWERRFRRIAK